MNDKETIIIGVGRRDPNTWTEQYLRQMYAEHPFDMNLIAANDKKIPVHSFVLMMFSPHLRNKFKTEMVFERGMDVSFNDYSYEVLSELVKMLYFGEVAIRVQMLKQFNKILQHLEIACPCCMPIECHNTPGEESDGEGWEETCDDPNVALLHGNEKMRHGCITPGCPAEIATKVVDGKIMVKKTNPNHSSECVKIQDENYGETNPTENLNRKRPKPKRHLAEKKDSDSDGSSKSSDNDVPKKQMKKTDNKPTVESIKEIEPMPIDIKKSETGDPTDKDNAQVGMYDRLIVESSDESDTSDSPLDSTDSSSDDDDSTSSDDN